MKDKQMKFKLLVAALALVSTQAFAYGFVTKQNTDGSMDIVNTKDNYAAFGVNSNGMVKAPSAELMDEFHWLNTSVWTASHGTGAPTPTITVSASGIVSVSAGTNASATTSLGYLASPLTFQASNGGLSAEARVAVNRATSSTAFFGFTDTSGVILPINITGTSATAFTANAVGLTYSTSATTKTWQGVGVKDSVTTTAVSTGVANVLSYTTLRVDVDTSGNADFWVNGAWKGRKANAVSTTVPLAVYLGAMNTVASPTTVYGDYIKAMQKR